MVEAQVSSRIMSQITEILVHEGDNVEGADGKGEKATLMARLDDRDIKARLRESQSQVKAMKQGHGGGQVQIGCRRSPGGSGPCQSAKDPCGL